MVKLGMQLLAKSAAGFILIKPDIVEAHLSQIMLAGEIINWLVTSNGKSKRSRTLCWINCTAIILVVLRRREKTARPSKTLLFMINLFYLGVVALLRDEQIKILQLLVTGGQRGSYTTAVGWCIVSTSGSCCGISRQSH